MDPHLAVVAKELAHRRLTKDRTLLIFSALPDAPVRDVTRPSRLRRLVIAMRRRWSIARRHAESTDGDACLACMSNSTWSETMSGEAHC